jgi:hypothetical protein
MSDKFAVSYIHGDNVSAEFMSSMMNLLLKDARGDNKIRSVLPMHSTVNISNSRNNTVRAFLNTDNDWLLMVDSDMVFKDTLLDDLLNGFTDVDEMPIIGSLTFSATRNGMLVPHIYYWAADDSAETLYTAKDYIKDGMIKVGAIGTGCLVVHRIALEKVFAGNSERPLPWFDQMIYKGILLGEDLTFCRRATDAGIPIHVNTRVRVGHVKPMILSEPMYDRQLKLDSLL